MLRIVKENYSLIECIMISAINEVETAVQAMKHGAYHYITKDFDYDELRSLVRNACERQDLNRQVITLSAQVAEQSEREFLIGPSRQIRDIVDLVQQGGEAVGDGADPRRERHRQGAAGAAAAPGVGTRRRAVHRGQPVGDSARAGREHAVRPRARRRSPARDKQQLGKFELAAGGTLFLDEIGDLRFDLQAKLLRAIQEGEIERVGGTKPIRTDFRLIVATNVDLETAVKEGRFREDLYYRINVIPIRMPPLRDRIEDLPELARLFLDRYKTKFRKPVQGRRRLGAEDPGVVLVAGQHPRAREPDRAAGRGERQGVDHRRGPAARVPLRQARRRRRRPSETLFQEACDTFERNFILRALEKSDWNVTATARYLGHPAQHAEAQDGAARPAGHGAEAPGRLSSAVEHPASRPQRRPIGWPTGQLLAVSTRLNSGLCAVSAHARADPKSQIDKAAIRGRSAHARPRHRTLSTA